MELALVGMAVMPASYLRAFGFSRWIRAPRTASLAAIAQTLLFALAMRLIMRPLLSKREGGFIDRKAPISL